MIGDRRSVGHDRQRDPARNVAVRTNRWLAPALSLGDLFMARRQLLNLKQLAERTAAG
jgi:hypothetical protein